MRKKKICRVFNLYIFMVLMAIIYKENQSGIVVNKKNWIFQIFPLSKEYFRLIDKNWGQSIIILEVMPLDIWDLSIK